jgi:hypothetical protein
VLVKTILENLTKDKQSSLLRRSVIYGQRSFTTLGPERQDDSIPYDRISTDPNPTNSPETVYENPVRLK